MVATTQSDLARHRARPRRLCVWDRILIYGTGGAAFGNRSGAAGRRPFSSSTQIGWTAGAGVEFAFTPNWTAKVEYLYVDLGNQSVPRRVAAFPAAAPGLRGIVTENVVRAGINYKLAGNDAPASG